VVKRAGGTGEHALQHIAGKVTSLLTSLNVGYTDTQAIIEVCKLDGLYRAHLQTLPTLDAGAEELSLTPCPGRAQSYLGADQQGNESQRRRTQHTCSKQQGTEETPACLLLTP
jgi:hypothetical protein